MTRTPSKPKASSRKSAERQGPSPEEALTNDLIALMERGVAPWRKPWDRAPGAVHCNLFSGHVYRGSNPMLLELGMCLRGSALPLWCGFAEAKKHGIFPKKGSKAVRIVRPQLNSREEEGENGETSLRSWVSYKPTCVFNVCDLEGEGLAKAIAAHQGEAPADEQPVVDPLPLAAETLGAWCVPVSRGGDKAYYAPAADRIVLPEATAFHSPAAHYATWAHEAIHSTGHESRLKREFSGSFGSPAYAREELVAELGSVLIGQRLQIGCELTSHAAYLQSWIGVLKESPTVLLRVISEARKAVDLICPEPAAEGDGPPPSSAPAP